MLLSLLGRSPFLLGVSLRGSFYFSEAAAVCSPTTTGGFYNELIAASTSVVVAAAAITYRFLQRDKTAAYELQLGPYRKAKVVSAIAESSHERALCDRKVKN